MGVVGRGCLQVLQEAAPSMDKNQGLTLTLPQSLNHLISQSPVRKGHWESCGAGSAHPGGWGWMCLRGCCRFTGHHPCFLPLKVLGPSPGPRRARSLAFILVLVGLESGLRMQMEAACGPGRYEPGSRWASLFPEPSSSVCQMAVLSLFNDFQCLFYSKTRERVVSGSRAQCTNFSVAPFLMGCPT